MRLSYGRCNHYTRNHKNFGLLNDLPSEIDKAIKKIFAYDSLVLFSHVPTAIVTHFTPSFYLYRRQLMTVNVGHNYVGVWYADWR